METPFLSGSLQNDNTTTRVAYAQHGALSLNGDIMHSKFRLFAPTVLAVLLAVCVATWVAYQNSSLILTNAIYENQALFAHEVSHSVARIITGAKRTAANIGRLPRVMDALREYEPSNVQHDVRFQNVITKIVEENPDFGHISIFASNGSALLDSSNLMTSIADTPFFQTVRKGTAVLDSAIFKRTGKLALFYAMPVMERGTFIGAVRVAINFNHLDQIWSDSILGDKGYRITIINNEGFILSCSHKNAHLELDINNMSSKKILGTLPQTLVEFTEENIEKIGMYVNIPDTNLRLIVDIDKDIFFKQVNELGIKAIFINVFIAVIVISVVLYTLQNLIHMIRSLEVSIGTTMEPPVGHE